MKIDLKKLTNLAETLERKTSRTKTKHANESWYRVTNAYQDEADVFIYDYIGAMGINASDFVMELNEIRASKINLHLSSGGGEVFDGIAIYNALMSHPAKVTTYIDSLAASAASFIAMAGDTVRMRKTARMMIHPAQGLCMGSEEDMLETAALLKDLTHNIAGIYADHAGEDVDHWVNLMKATTWFSAEQAYKAGLVDEIISGDGEIEEQDEEDEDEETQVSKSPSNTAPAWDASAMLNMIKEGTK